MVERKVEEFLAHMLAYDPVQAHTYYEEHKKLKGRQKGAVQPILHPRQRGVVKPLSPQTHQLVKQHGHVKLQQAHPPKKSAAQLQKETTIRVKELTAKLGQLQKLLAQLVKQAKQRSGIKVAPTKHAPGHVPPPKHNSHTSTSHLTAAQKAAKAKAAKAAYVKTHPQSSSQQEVALKAKIADVTKKIKAMRAQLAHAQQLAQQAAHSTSNSVGVRNKPNK